MEKIIGVYCIRNLVNNKLYIGSTIHIKQRFREHKKALNNGVHHSYHLQASWNKYGKDKFEFEILETFSDCDILTQRELDLILKYKTNEREFGYNISLPSPTGSGVCKHSDETKELLRRLYYKSRFKSFKEEEYQEWLIRKPEKKIKVYKDKKDWERHHKCPVVVLNLQGEVVNKYTSIHEACRELNLKIRRVNDHMSKRLVNKGNANPSIRKSVNGYIFIRESEYDPNKDYTYKQERNHAILCTKGDFTKEYNSPQEAAEELGIKVGRIYEVLRGYANTCGGGYKNGYSFKYKEEFAKKFKEVS